MEWRPAFDEVGVVRLYLHVIELLTADSTLRHAATR